MDSARLRAWWAQRQGLDGSLQGASPQTVLERAGWARSVGGVGPYLTIFARSGAGREAVDQAVADVLIHELPSARNCTYVVPAADFALALRVGQEMAEAQLKVGYKLGVTEAEIEVLCAAVLVALDRGPLDPEQIRAAVGGAVRSLGDEGKKKGVTTTLPLALGKLQSEGEIRRVPSNGRLDQQRYFYTRWSPNPLAVHALPLAEAYTELGRRFFGWVGPATIREFSWFSGLGLAASKSALAPLDLVPLEAGSDRLLFAEDRAALADFVVLTEPRYALVSGLDPISAQRRDVQSLLDEADASHPVFARGKTAGSTLVDLPHPAILDRGRLVGFWEYDYDQQSIVWMTFRSESESLHATVTETERCVRDQLGDARTFSLDSPKSRVPRIEAVRNG